MSSAQSVKASILSTNFGKIKALLSDNLNSTIKALPSTMAALFSDVSFLAATSTIDTKISALRTTTVAEFASKGQTLDVTALPENWTQALDESFSTCKTGVQMTVNASWSTWLTKLSYSTTATLNDKLQKLASSTAVGNASAYNNGISAIKASTTTSFNQEIDTNYLLDDKPTQKAIFSKTIDDVCTTARAVWEQNDADVQANLSKLVKRLQSIYQIQLQNSLTPQVEPAPYNIITDDSKLKVCHILVCL